MESIETTPGYQLWEPPASAVWVECSHAVLEQIRLLATEAFYKLPHGGLEVGGILYGSRTNQRVRIEAMTAVTCEHALGPGYVLSPKDKQHFAQTLERHQGVPEGLRAVGWFHSHTRSGIFLSDRDLEIHRAMFPEFWQVALVVKPAHMRPMRAGFFAPTKEGEFPVLASLEEFEVAPRMIVLPPAIPELSGHDEQPGAPPKAAAMAALTAELAARFPMTIPPVASPEAPPAATPEPPAAVAVGAESSVASAPRLPELSFLQPPEEPKRRKLPWLAASAASVALLVGIATGVWYADPLLRWSGITDRMAAPAVTISTGDEPRHLRVRWDADAPSVRGASGGTLEVEDGALARTLPLTPEQLRGGEFSIWRQDERVDVKLSLSPGGRSSSAGFAGAVTDARLAAAQENAERRATELAKENETLRKEKAALEARLRRAPASR